MISEPPIHPPPVRAKDGSMPAMLDLETGLDFLNADHQPIIERHLLGCCFNDSFSFDEAAEIVEPSDFTMDEHSQIFNICREMRDKNRQITTADIYQYLVQMGRVNFPCFKGNASWWLHETADLEPTGSRARYYAHHIREAATFRRLRGVASEILGASFRPFGPSHDVLGYAESLLFNLSNAAGPTKETLVAAKVMLQEAIERIDQRHENGGKLVGIPSGYTKLDEHLAGFRNGQMIVIGARPSVGKTALALSIASNIALSGIGVLFFSLEMPKSEIADRLLSMQSGVALHRINSTRFADGDIHRIAVAASPDGIGGCDFFLDDNCDQTAERMLQISRRAIRKFGIQIILVDYLQLIRPENARVNRNEQVGTLARKVKLIARQLQVPVICLAQLNREVESRNGVPRLSDLRDSGEIEQHADGVVLLHRESNPDENAATWDIDAIIAKNRNGPIGTAPLRYLRTSMKFDNPSNW